MRHARNVTDHILVRPASLEDVPFVESIEVSHGVPVGRLRQKVENGDIIVAEDHGFLLSSCELDEPEPQAWHRKMGFTDCGVLFGLSPGRYGDLFLN